MEPAEHGEHQEGGVREGAERGANLYRDEARNFQIHPPESDWQRAPDAAAVHAMAAVAYTLYDGAGALIVIVEQSLLTLDELVAGATLNLRAASSSSSVLRQERAARGSIPAVDMTCRSTVQGDEFIHCYRCLEHNGRAYQVIAWAKGRGPDEAEELARPALESFRLLDETLEALPPPESRYWEGSNGRCGVDAPHPEWKPSSAPREEACVLDLLYKDSFARFQAFAEPWSTDFAALRECALRAFQGRCEPDSFQILQEKPWPGLEGKACLMAVSAAVQGKQATYLYTLYCKGTEAYQVHAYADPLIFPLVKASLYALTNSFLRYAVRGPKRPEVEGFTCQLCSAPVRAYRILWQRFLEAHAAEQDKILMHLCAQCGAQVCPKCGQESAKLHFHWWSGWDKCACPVCGAPWQPQEVGFRLPK